LPRRLAPFKSSAPYSLAHEVDRPNMIHFDLEDRLNCRSNLGLRGVPINSKCEQLLPILRLFLCDQRFLSNYRRLDDVPNGSHFLGRLLLLWFSCSLRLWRGLTLRRLRFLTTLGRTWAKQLIQLLGSR